MFYLCFSKTPSVFSVCTYFHSKWCHRLTLISLFPSVLILPTFQTFFTPGRNWGLGGDSAISGHKPRSWASHKLPPEGATPPDGLLPGTLPVQAGDGSAAGAWTQNSTWTSASASLSSLTHKKSSFMCISSSGRTGSEFPPQANT